MKLSWLALALTFFAGAAHAQGTGAAFPTPNTQTVPGVAILGQCGSIVNGQPVMCPPGLTNPIPVNITNALTAPVPAASNPIGGTIAATNVFQLLITSNSARKACSIQNNGTHPQFYSYTAGVLGLAPTNSNSFTVYPGWTFHCASGGSISISDTLYIAGTINESFYGGWQ